MKKRITVFDLKRCMKIDVFCLHPAYFFPGVVEEGTERLPSLQQSRSGQSQQMDVLSELDVVPIAQQIGAAKKVSSPVLILMQRVTPVLAYY